MTARILQNGCIRKERDKAAALNSFKSAVIRFGSSTDNEALLARERCPAKLSERDFKGAVEDLIYCQG